MIEKILPALELNNLSIYTVNSSHIVYSVFDNALASRVAHRLKHKFNALVLDNSNNVLESFIAYIDNVTVTVYVIT